MDLSLVFEPSERKESETPAGLLQTVEAKSFVLYQMAKMARVREKSDLVFPDLGDEVVTRALKNHAFAHNDFETGFFLANKYKKLEAVVKEITNLSADKPEYGYTDSFLGLPEKTGRYDRAYKLKKAVVKHVLLPSKMYEEAIGQLVLCNEPKSALDVASEISPERVAQLAESLKGEYEWAIRLVKQHDKKGLESRLQRKEVEALVEGTERENGKRDFRWYLASEKAKKYGFKEVKQRKIAFQAAQYFVRELESKLKSEKPDKEDIEKVISSARSFTMDLAGDQRERQKSALFKVLRTHNLFSEMYDTAIKLQDYDSAFEAATKADSISREHKDNMEKELISNLPDPERKKVCIQRWFLGDYHRACDVAGRHGLKNWLIDAYVSRGTPQDIANAASIARDMQNGVRARELFLAAGLPEWAVDHAETNEEKARLCVMAGEKFLRENSDPRSYNFNEGTKKAMHYFGKSLDLAKKESDLKKPLLQAEIILQTLTTHNRYVEAVKLSEELGADSFRIPEGAISYYERFLAFNECAFIADKIGKKREATLYAQLAQYFAEKR